MADVFIEQLVIQKTLPQNKLIKLGLWFSAIILFVVLSFFSFYIGQVATILAVGSLCGAWYFSQLLNIEYEYIYMNGEIDFDKIMGRRKRKRIFTVRVSSFEEFGQYTANFDKSRFDIKYNFAENLCETDYYMTFKNKEGKSCVLFFSPNEKLANELNKEYSRKVKFGK